jgi:hypothetical protein
MARVINSDGDPTHILVLIYSSKDEQECCGSTLPWKAIRKEIDVHLLRRFHGLLTPQRRKISLAS